MSTLAVTDIEVALRSAGWCCKLTTFSTTELELWSESLTIESSIVGTR